MAQNAGGSSVGIQSPTAASLGKFGETPVSYYTGQANVTIPLHNLQSRSLSIPVALRYSGGEGVRVEETPGWVGMGWALEAGGVITRTMRGLPDDRQTYGYLSTAAKLEARWTDLASYEQTSFFDASPSWEQNLQDYIADIELGRADPEPDQFFFNFGGRSGKIVLASPSEIYTVPNMPLQIEIERGSVALPAGSSVADAIREFTITTEDGTQYIFGTTNSDNESLEFTYFDYQASTGQIEIGYVSTWYLREIRSAVGDDTIAFSYTRANARLTHQVKDFHEEYIPINQAASGNGCIAANPNQLAPVENFQHTSNIYLDTITSGNGMSMRFDSSSRTGYMDPEYRKLDRIEVVGREGLLIRSFNFSYDQHSVFGNRLLLTSVEEKGEGDAALLAPYTFDYHGETGSLTLPGRFSNDIDHRGYFNNAGNSTDLSSVVYKDASGAVHSYVRGNREPDEAAMQVGMLSRITYPTGGYTEFEYEGHTYSQVVEPGNNNSDYSVEDEAVTRFESGASYLAGGSNTTPFSIEGTVPVNVRIEALFNSVLGPQNVEDLGMPQGALLEPASPVNGQVARFSIINSYSNVILSKEHDCGTLCSTDPELSYSTSLEMAPGDYILETYSEYEENSDTGTSIDVDLYWVELHSVNEKLAGGLRIRQIKYVDPTGTGTPDKVHRYEYARSDNGFSSGVLSGEPRHYYYKGDHLSCIEIFNNTQAMGMLGVGQEVGYSEVTEFYAIDNSEGWSKYSFITAAKGPKYRDDPALDSDVVDYNDALWLNGQKTSLAYKRGVLEEVVHYNSAGTPVARSTSTYFDSFYDDYVELDPSGSALLTRLVPALVHRNGGSGQTGQHTYLKRYYVVSAFHAKKTDIQYVDNGEGGLKQMSYREYFYDDDEHLQLTKLIEKVPSRNDRVTEHRYAHEIQTGMKAKNMLVQRQWSGLSEGASLKRKNWTEWNLSGGYWRPYKEWVWKGGSEGGDVPSTSVADLITSYLTYDSHGNLTSSEDARGTRSSYAWGHSNSVPTAIRVNTGSVDEQITMAAYDNNTLRLRQITDPDGVSAFFEYDAMGRLREVKDDDSDSEGSQPVTFYDYKLDPNYVETIGYGGTSPDVTTRVYLDGFGAERQIHVKQGNDAIVTALTLDKRGRADRIYKPYEAGNGVSSGWGWFHTGYDGKAKSYYADFAHDNSRPYRVSEYAQEPLSRPIEVWPEGVTTSTRAIRTDYGVSGDYTYVRETDENGHIITAYSDGYGNKDRIEAPLGATTSFVYDVLGQLEESRSPIGLATSYTYDSRGRLVLKSTPDAEGDFEYSYDISDNLRFLEDPNQRDADRYVYYKYDDFNRLIEEGIYTGGTGFDSANPDDDGFPMSGKVIKTSYVYNGSRLESVAFHHEDGASGSYTYGYDLEGRIGAIIVDLGDLPPKTIEYSYDRQGRITRIRYEDGSSDAFYHWYDYDAAGRLEQIQASEVDNLAGATEVATYTYFPEGYVRTLRLGSAANPVQTLDYEYHIRGWLAAINDPDNLMDGGSMQGDAFGMELAYEDNPGWPTTYSAQHNGNVGAMKWSTRGNDTVGGTRSGYSFTYDDLNRLSQGDYHAYNGAWSNTGLFDLDVVTYDDAGNILTLDRKDNTGSGSLWNYTYTAGTNRLYSLTDHGTFAYDKNGNMRVGQIKAGIASTLQYNFRNLPETITVDGNTFSYRYDASGRRIYSSAGAESYYVRGSGGEVMAVYDGSGALVYVNLLAGSQPLGRFNK